MKPRLVLAGPSIVEQFDSSSKRVYRFRDIEYILANDREKWNLARATRTEEFLKFLIATGDLREEVLAFPQQTETLFVWKNASPFLIAAAARPHAYLCHETAMFLHGLRDGELQNIYINAEQRPHSPSDGPLRQHAIDNAFKRPQRLTKNQAKLGKHTLHLINGMHTSGLGVVTKNDPDGRPLRVTGVERTLIDITVRPAYAGGSASVLEAFRRAHGSFTVAGLAATLQKMGFVYPYHQAVGFYLERTGHYSPRELDPLREPRRTRDFYLDYAMKTPAYSKPWRIYYPSDL